MLPLPPCSAEVCIVWVRILFFGYPLWVHCWILMGCISTTIFFAVEGETATAWSSAFFEAGRHCGSRCDPLLAWSSRSTRWTHFSSSWLIALGNPDLRLRCRRNEFPWRFGLDFIVEGALLGGFKVGFKVVRNVCYRHSMTFPLKRPFRSAWNPEGALSPFADSLTGLPTVPHYQRFQTRTVFFQALRCFRTLWWFHQNVNTWCYLRAMPECSCPSPLLIWQSSLLAVILP